MEEFLDREGGKDGIAPIPEEQRERIESVKKNCVRRRKGECYTNHHILYFCLYVNSDRIYQFANITMHR